MLTSTLLFSAAAAGALLAPRLGRLRQRYDKAALVPIDAAAPRERDNALVRSLAEWVYAGAGHGATLLPWGRPALPTPLAIARIGAHREAAVRHFAYRLAGYHQLDERSRASGIMYRIGVQLRPLAWFLRWRGDEPWDDAWLTQVNSERLTALKNWRPRRPTLIVLTAPNAANALIDALQHAAQHGDRPIRLLILERGGSATLRPVNAPLSV